MRCVLCPLSGQAEVDGVALAVVVTVSTGSQNCHKTFFSWRSGNAHTSIMLGVYVIAGDQLLLRSISGQRVQPKSVALLEWVYANGATGLALLRCEGFASMNTENAEGILLTRLVAFNGEHIFEMSMRPEAA